MPNGREQPVVRTERLILRLGDPFDPTDCRDVLRIYNDPDVAKKSVTSINTIADVQEKFRRHGPRPGFCTLAAPPNGMFFLIYLPLKGGETPEESNLEGDFVGQMHLSFRPEMPYPDLGYALLAPYEGRGYATEAGQAVLHFWRESVGVNEIFVGTAPDNIRSQKLAERLGFVKAGTFDVVFGHPPNERWETDGQAFILPGMTWIEGKTMKLTIGAKAETS